MSRLTEHMPDYLGYVEFQFKRGVNEQDAVSRLGEIEDILYASDGSERITIDRLRELVDAERDGRIVVLPCKAGDAVYPIDIDRSLDKPPLRVTAVRFTGFELDGWVEIGCLKYKFSDISKTVFLTRAEAEQALVRAEAEAKGEQE